jgi:hypothetical protein
MLSTLSPAEDLPTLYRSLLDAVAELETRGAHRQATVVRAAATRAYSTSWDETGRRQLEQLARRVGRVIDEIDHPVPPVRSFFRLGADGIGQISRLLHSRT